MGRPIWDRDSAAVHVSRTCCGMVLYTVTRHVEGPAPGEAAGLWGDELARVPAVHVHVIRVVAAAQRLLPPWLIAATQQLLQQVV